MVLVRPWFEVSSRLVDLFVQIQQLFTYFVREKFYSIRILAESSVTRVMHFASHLA